MSLDRDRMEVSTLCVELRGELQDYGIERLQELGAKRENQHHIGKLVHETEVMMAYLQETPAGRKECLKKLSEDDRAMFVLVALYHARRAFLFLDLIAKHEVLRRKSDRAITARAAMAAYTFSGTQPIFWPFEGLYEDPFFGA